MFVFAPPKSLLCDAPRSPVKDDETEIPFLKVEASFDVQASNVQASNSGAAPYQLKIKKLQKVPEDWEPSIEFPDLTDYTFRALRYFAETHLHLFDSKTKIKRKDCELLILKHFDEQQEQQQQQ